MATPEDEDWLALQVAASQSPFKTFQRPDAPFEAPDPGPDEVYTTRDILGATNAPKSSVSKAMAWLRARIPFAKPGPEPKTWGDAGLSLGKHAYNFGLGIPDALLHSAEHYGGWQGHRMGEFDPGAVLVPPNPLLLAGFLPRGARNSLLGEGSGPNAVARVRAKLEDWRASGKEGAGAGQGVRDLTLRRAQHDFHALGPQVNDLSPSTSPTHSAYNRGVMDMREGNIDPRTRRLNAQAGDDKLTKLVAQATGPRTEPLPMARWVASWLEQATGKPDRDPGRTARIVAPPRAFVAFAREIGAP